MNMEKTEFRFEVIRSGRRFLSLDTRMLRDFINGFVAENAMLMYDKKLSLREEREFQKSKAKEIDAKNAIFVLCWQGNRLVGSSDARKEKFKQSHNASFGLIVRKGFRGMGIGEKLLSLAMREARKSLKAKNLWIEHIEGNLPARSLYEKLGFREVARLKSYVRHKGSYRDKILMQYFGNR